MEEIIVNMVEKKFNTDLHKNRNCRKREYVEARSVYFKLMRELTRNSLAKIGETLDKDHACVLHSLKKFEVYYKYSDLVKESYDEIYLKLYKHKSKRKFYTNALYHRDYNDNLMMRLAKYKIQKRDDLIDSLEHKVLMSNNPSISNIHNDVLKAVKLIPESQLINAIPRINAMAKMMQSAKYN